MIKPRPKKYCENPLMWVMKKKKKKRKITMISKFLGYGVCGDSSN